MTHFHTLLISIIYGVPMMFLFHWGIDVGNRNFRDTSTRLIAAQFGAFLLMLFAVFAIQVLPKEYAPPIAIFGIGTLGVILTALGVHLLLRTLGWITRWPKGLGVALSYIWVVPGLWTLVTGKNIFNVSQFYADGLWVKPYYNAPFHIAMIFGSAMVAIFSIGLGWTALHAHDANTRGKFLGLFWGMVSLTVANAVLGAALPEKTAGWLPPYPYLVGMMAWLIAVRYSIVKYELLPGRLGRYQTLFTATPLPILMADARGHIVETNAAALSLFGKEPKSLSEVVVAEDRTKAFRVYRHAFSHHQSIQEWHLSVIDCDNSVRSVVVNGDYISVGSHVYSLLVVRDITEEQIQRTQLTHLAFHDPLTGLPNAFQFRQQLGDWIDRDALHQDRFAVLMIDLDNFKTLNDTWGHQMGDEALIAVAQRLSENRRSRDLVSRIGGDEFMMILADAMDQEATYQTAHRILSGFREPIILTNGEPFKVTLSIGVSMYPIHGRDADGLIRAADQAMYAAKRAGKNLVHMYDGHVAQLSH
ncbi:MAG: hypothetical protein C7B46_13280 [Sulfobacillus benefaciens]|uniref:GGDEF domain-containing protein n=1 Tax=Sulfobacillus benefaciens TaxID=453960 RepID=A0A2T2XDX8_9FIRM|nr:MAG: hypothetical protein C7B46_13280 [Sulfobacillus benefaciens]